jgi:FkbM family methyltransferase
MVDFNNILEFQTPFGKIAYLKNDEPFIRTLRQDNKIYEQDLILTYVKNIIKKSKVVLDIGAHAGGHTLIFKHLNPSLEIHSFEPQSEVFKVLYYNISYNNLQNVILYNKAVANKNIITTLSDKVIELEFDPLTATVNSKVVSAIYKGLGYNNFGGVQLGENGQTVKTITIDSLNLDKCDFMKIDVEGAECLVLLGAQETIKKCKPFIWFESNYQKLDERTNIKFDAVNVDIFKLLKKLNYKNILQMDKDNYLAIPEEN